MRPDDDLPRPDQQDRRDRRDIGTQLQRIALFVVLMLALLLVSAVARRLRAQEPAPAPAASDTVRGLVRDAAGAPLAGLNVFLLETLDGALTGPDGRFAFATAARGTVTLVARRAGLKELRRPVAPAERHALELVMTAGTAQLAPITVQAGRYTTGSDRGATLTPLEVVSTPGTAADVNRAIQLLPGVQNVDEGNALFVRGGDYTETKTFLDGGEMLDAVQLQRHVGTFAGTVDPFLLDGIAFASGGMGARYGNALSAVAVLRTLGRPTGVSATATAGLAALSAAGALPGPHGTGLRVAANRFDLEPLLRVNGTTRGYEPPPHGADLSGSAHWRYGAAGELRLFAVRQSNDFALDVDEASHSGAYSTDLDNGFAVLSWSDLRGRFAPSVSVSRSTLGTTEGYGAFRLRTDLQLTQVNAQGEWAQNDRLTLRGGVQFEQHEAGFDGTVPASAHDVGDGAVVSVLASRVDGERTGLWAEADWQAGGRVRLVGGVRTDRSSLTDARTIDPRLSAAFTVRPGIVLTAAWGVYHQVPDPLHYDPVLGDPTLPPMRATQAIVGVQAGGDDGALARVELYHKRSAHLAQMTRDYIVVGDGTGRAHGADLFVKVPLGASVTGRMTYGWVVSRRTDPHTGIVAPAPFDVTHSLAIITERSWGPSLKTAMSYRKATGRPVTPVLGASFDAAREVWVPAYGAPYAERLPDFGRIDLSASYFRRLTPSLQGVAFVALTNVLDRHNVHGYTYSPDYRTRTPIRSLFNRSIYLGASLTLL